jgi:hypothetical protein
VLRRRCPLLERTPWQGRSLPQLGYSSVPSRTKKPFCEAFSMGGTGLEPTPSLSTWCSRSRQFAGVRSSRMVKRNPSRHRTPERTRTNADPCHSCHATPAFAAGSFEIPIRFGSHTGRAHPKGRRHPRADLESSHTNKPSEGWNIRTRRLSDRKPVCVTSSRARSLHNQRSQRSTHEHPMDHPDRRPCARPAWLFRSRPLLGIGLRHA